MGNCSITENSVLRLRCLELATRLPMANPDNVTSLAGKFLEFATADKEASPADNLKAGHGETSGSSKKKPRKG